MTYKHDFEVLGKEWRVIVKRNSDRDEKYEHRIVKVIDLDTYNNKGHSYLYVTDKARDVPEGILRDKEEIPPLGEHVGRAVNKAIQKYLRKESKNKTKEQTIKNAVKSTKRIWEEEFETTENFK